MTVSNESSPAAPTVHRLFVSFAKEDTCLGITYFAASDARELPEGAVEFAGNGRSVTLSYDLELASPDPGGGPGEIVLPLHLDLAWTALDRPFLSSAGRVWASDQNVHLFFFNDRSQHYQAHVTGSATDGTIEYTGGEFAETVIANSTSATLLIPGSVRGAGSSHDHGPAGTTSTSSVVVWERFEEGGCIRHLGIVVFDRLEDVTNAFVDFSVYDHCANVPLFWVQAHDPALPASAIALERTLAFADLEASVNGIDMVSGLPVNLDVSLHLTGAGAVAAARTSAKTTEKGVTIFSRSNSRWRFAVPTGSVMLGETNLIAGCPVGPSDFSSAGFGENTTIERVSRGGV